ERVAVAAIAGDMAVLAPRVRDVQIVADECETPRDLQRMRAGRGIEQQRMLLARLAVVVEHADVLDARLPLTPIADPPHDASSPRCNRRCARYFDSLGGQRRS